VTATATPELTPDQRELVITRTFDAPRELVFKAWIAPEHALQWWGPHSHPATRVEMDVRPGGRWRKCLRSVESGQEVWNHGVFREITPPSRLVFTFAWEQEGERGLETVVTVDFAEHNGKTRMTFRQTPFQSIEERDGHHGGWSGSFDRLADLLAGAEGDRP
jgi:uncharacterized protein YndB with AHSA1/START domain